MEKQKKKKKEEKRKKIQKEEKSQAQIEDANSGYVTIFLKQIFT